MARLTDPSRYVGRSVVYINGANSDPARVVAVGSGGIVIDTKEGQRLIAPSEISRLETAPTETTPQQSE